MTWKSPYFIVAVLIVAAVAVSLLLMPDRKEIALMQMKSDHFEEAQRAYEEQLAQGDLSIDAVSQLSDIYIKAGQVDKAITVLESYLAGYPNNVSVRIKLSTYYQYAERQDDYLRNLEIISRLQPDEDSLSKLSQLYSSSKQYDKQAETLKKLIDIEGGKEPQHFIDLANVSLSNHSYDDAEKALRDLHRMHPDKFTFKEAELLITILLNENKTDLAASESAGWVKAHHVADDGAKLAMMLHFKINASAGLALISNFTDVELNGSAALLEQYVLVEGELQKEEVAYKRLAELYKANILPPSLNHYLLFMAASRKQMELVKDVLHNTDLASLSESQLLTLVELAQTQKAPEVLGVLSKQFPASQYAVTQPLLIAALAVSLHEDDMDQQLSKVHAMKLDTSQSLHMARVCAYVKNYDCTGKFIEKIKNNEGMSDAEVADIGALYFQMDQQDKGYIFVMDAVKTHNTAEIKLTAIQFAAARGEDDKVVAWLKENPKSDQHTLSDLYYAAANHHQWQTASIVAETLHSKFETADINSMLAESYVRTGRFGKVVQLLRANGVRSEQDENNFLSALIHLASEDTGYRQELGEYALGKLHSTLPEKDKVTLVYTLMNAQVTEYAMPYIHELAIVKGGQWASYYADSLDKQGKHDEARQFWLNVANQAGRTRKEKGAIASNLLAHGYKADAQKLYYQLAANATADSDEVKALMYMWGPRPNAQQLQWLKDRYSQAGKNSKNDWLMLYSYAVNDEEMIQFIHEHPEALSNEKILTRYMQALVDNGQFADASQDIFARAQETHNVKLMHEYGKIARQNGLTDLARKTYEAIIIIAPEDNTALREAGLIAYEQAEYTNAEMYLGEYFKTRHKDETPAADGYQAYFDYGAMLRRHQQLALANEYFAAAITYINDNNLDDAGALSVEAQCQAWLGDPDGGLNTFAEAVRKYPTNYMLRADMIGLFVELKRYDEASRLLAAPRDMPVQPHGNGALQVPGDKVNTFQVQNEGRELWLQLKHALAKSDTWPDTLSKSEGVGYVSQGYDTVLIVAKPGYRFVSDGPAHFMLVAKEDKTEDEKQARQVTLRYELLAARIDLENGRIYEATVRLNTLLSSNPSDPQLLAFAATAENYGGNWGRAQELLDMARAQAADNDDFKKFERDLRRQHAQNLTVDHEWTKLGTDHETITTISGYANYNSHMIAGALLQNNDVDARQHRYASGVIGNVKEDRQRGELYVQSSGINGQQWKASLFANNNTPGMGGYYTFLNPLGQTALAAEVHKPYWELPDAMVADATRDRLSMLHTIRASERLTLDGGPNINRYNMVGESNVLSTAGMKFDAVYRLLDDKPFLALGYGFDAEYALRRKKLVDSTGATTRIFPLVSREMHFFSVNAGYNFNDSTYGDMLAGYGYDRLGGHGPTLLAKLTHEFTDRLDVQLRALYGQDTASSNNTTTTFGGYLRWRFQ